MAKKKSKKRVVKKSAKKKAKKKEPPFIGHAPGSEPKPDSEPKVVHVPVAVSVPVASFEKAIGQVALASQLLRHAGVSIEIKLGASR